MASVVEICNLALASIRAESINSLNESSIQAQQCKLHYDIARKVVLRATPWQFAKKTTALSLRTEEPLKWVYAYQYPSNCLKLIEVVADIYFKNQTDIDDVYRTRFISDYVVPDPLAEYEVMNDGDNKVIVTDMPDAYVSYIHNVTDTTLFDDIFVLALSQFLGSLIAVSIVGAELGAKMRSANLQNYSDSINTAIAENMNERKRRPRREPSLVSVRR